MFSKYQSLRIAALSCVVCGNCFSGNLSGQAARNQYFYDQDVYKRQKTDWVRSEFREQEKYRRNYYGTIFLEILLEKMQRKEDVLYIESVRAPRVVRVKRRKKEPDPKNCNVMEKQNEPVAKTCDEHRSKEPAASGGRSVQSVQNVQDMPVMPEIRLSNEPAERLQKGRSGLEMCIRDRV